jgi:hypothetical protein
LSAFGYGWEQSPPRKVTKPNEADNRGATAFPRRDMPSRSPLITVADSIQLQEGPHRHDSAPDLIRIAVGGEMARGTTIRGDRPLINPTVFLTIHIGHQAKGESRPHLHL